MTRWGGAAANARGTNAAESRQARLARRFMRVTSPERPTDRAVEDASARIPVRRLVADLELRATGRKRGRAIEHVAHAEREREGAHSGVASLQVDHRIGAHAAATGADPR